MSILSIDPGLRNGVAYWRDPAVLDWKAIMGFDDLMDWLEEDRTVNLIVMENYITDHRAGKLKGSKNDASQTIGAVRAFCRRRHLALVIQSNSILKPMAMNMGVPLPANGHFKDDVSAMLHGAHYFWSQGMRVRDIQV